MDGWEPHFIRGDTVCPIRWSTVEVTWKVVRHAATGLMFWEMRLPLLAIGTLTKTGVKSYLHLWLKARKPKLLEFAAAFAYDEGDLIKPSLFAIKTKAKRLGVTPQSLVPDGSVRDDYLLTTSGMLVVFLFCINTLTDPKLHSNAIASLAIFFNKLLPAGIVDSLGLAVPDYALLSTCEQCRHGSICPHMQDIYVTLRDATVRDWVSSPRVHSFLWGGYDPNDFHRCFFFV